jgi:hypothetical protein
VSLLSRISLPTLARVLACAATAACLSLAAPDRAAAQLDDERPPGLGDSQEEADEEEGPAPEVMPMRILGSVGAGSMLRIINDLSLSQERIGPSFLDIAGSYVFAGAGLFRHGATLAISTNLNGEGPPPPDDNGIDPVTQWTLTPSYLAYLRFNDDFVLSGRAGVNLTVAPYFVPGIEVSAGATYLFTAGLGAYAEVSANVSFGVAPEPSPTASVELGLMIDYEVLP